MHTTVTEEATGPDELTRREIREITLVRYSFCVLRRNPNPYVM